MTTDGPSSELSAPGGFVDVMLPENPSTGYRWAPQDGVPGAELVGDRYEDRASDGPAAGAGGTRIFSLHVTGTVVMEFALKQPWASDVVERRTVRITATD